MTQTQADRSAAAKKAAATRERNQVRRRSQATGHRAASARQVHEAQGAAHEARRRAVGVFRGAVTGTRSAARFAAIAAVEVGKAAASRAKVLSDR